MAEIKWTDDQEKAISCSGKNILVSAAAGSGKTAVLVERVMRQITRKENPADIGSFVIVTFTRAAAAQMRDKLYRGIRKAIQADPDNENLKCQLHRVHIARIYTIDALCMEIVRDNFQAADIDPGFRLADESEIRMLKADVIAELLENEYREGSEEFLHFVDFYMDKSDSKIESIILDLYGFAQSHPNPEKWIEGCSLPYTTAAEYGNDCPDEQKRWIQELGNLINDELRCMEDEARLGLKIAQAGGGPDKYEPYFEKIIEFIKDVTGDDKTFSYHKEAIDDFISAWERSPSCGKDVDGRLKEAAKVIRSDIKDKLVKLKKRFFRVQLEDLFMEMSECQGIATQITGLTLKFAKAFSEAKKEKNVVDFNDIEHMALRILADESLGLGDSMAKEISEIIVDEYQDTNELQDAIIYRLSSERFGRPNVFMVGDVKQSIYGFRLACPRLFNEKYDSYLEEPGKDDGNMLIKLNANFRSRKEVIDLVNYIFSQTMVRKVGGTEYARGHELRLGASYTKEESGEFIPEIIMFSGGKEARKNEAYEITRRIQELIRSGKVSDGEGFKNVTYNDIAILTRNSSNPEIEKMLEAAGIPYVTSSGKGFFEAFEVRLALNILAIIDNPYQDIPLAAVLTSPILGLSGNELAGLKIAYKKIPFILYEACRCEDGNPELKLFIERLEYYRRCCAHMPIGDFYEMVINDSGLVNCVLAMPGGEGRLSNLGLLKNQIKIFSGISDAGLFGFLRYIERIRKIGIDFGQAGNLEDDVCAVRMMTIHKSKGLEFPIVFLADCGHQYNENDLRRSIMMDKDYGIGLEKRDVSERTVTRTMLMETIIAKKKKELYAEEMRLLYVGMTRAKEKLIITGNVKGLDKLSTSWCNKLFSRSNELSPSEILSDNTYMKVIGNAIACNPASNAIFEAAGFGAGELLEKNSLLFSLECFDEMETEEKRVEEILDAEDFGFQVQTAVDSQDEGLSELFSWSYPYEQATKMQVKFSASQLEKHEDLGKRPFLPKTEGLTGADRGNAYHRFFELLDYNNPDVEQMLKDFEGKKLMSQSETGAVQPSAIEAFLGSGIGKRMKGAYQNGLLVREQQFVMGLEEGGEKRLIQGIIDAFFEEDGEIVIVDYKTDRNRTEEELVNIYRGQLEAYAMVLRAATGKNVKGIYIYAVEYGKEIEVKEQKNDCTGIHQAR